MAAKKFARLTGALQASALQQAEPDRLFGGSRQGMRLVEPRLEDIDVNPDQPRRRFDPESLAGLAESIAQHGQKQPVGVRPQENGRWTLVFGERRLRACRRLGLTTIQAVVTDGDALEIALIENLQREDLSAFETADAFAALMQRRGCNRSTLAKVVGATPSAITRMLGLRDLPADIRQECESGFSDVSKSLLLELVDIGDDVVRRNAWEAIKTGATVRRIRELRQEGALDQPAESSAGTERDSGSDGMSELVSPRRRPALTLIRTVEQLEKRLSDCSRRREALDETTRLRLATLRSQIDELLRQSSNSDF